MYGTDSSGAYSSYYQQTIGKCTKCEPKGFLLVNGGYSPCSCYREYTRMKKLHDSGLPKAYWPQSLDVFDGCASAKAVITDYIFNLQANLISGKGLYIYGPPGVGKTLLSSYILKAGLALGKTCHFYYFNDVLSTFTDAWKNDAARVEVENSIIGSDLLVLDDLGREFKSNKRLHESILDAVVRTRANNLRPLIITSNLDLYDIKDTYGAVIIDLFHEGLRTVKVTGDSYRRKNNGPA